MKNYPDDVSRIAERIAGHRAIPFLGAGCSTLHLGVDWDALRVEMVGSDRAAGLTHPHAASVYVAEHSRTDLIALLKRHLLVAKFDDSKGGVPLYIMGMGFSRIYSTNQDNVLETCYRQFGRDLDVVVRFKDLAEQDPRRPALYKYHGSLEYQDTVVFTQEDYDARMSTDTHPLDIRLRSDCLSKSLIFFGYSFRDPNVQLIFRHLLDVFGKDLPPAFLIQYYPDRQFESELADAYGITAVDCTASYPGTASPGEAFDRFLADLNNCVAGMRDVRDIESSFGGGGGSPSVRVASRYEVEGLEQAITRDKSARIVDLAAKFRSVYDRAFIAPTSRPQVGQQYVQLCERVRNTEDYGAVKFALTWLKLDLEQMTEALAACCAAANVLSADESQLAYHPPPTSLVDIPDVLFLGAVAYSFQLLRKWGRSFSKGFYMTVDHWSLRFSDVASLSPDYLDMLNACIGDAYGPGKTHHAHPIESARRMGGLGMRAPGFHELLASLEGMLPRKLVTRE